MTRPFDRRHSLLILALAAAVSLPAAVHATDAPLPAGAERGRFAVAPAQREAWAAELRDLRGRELADLAQRAAAARTAAPGPAQADAVRDLEQAKREWRRRVLSTQLRYARAAGSLETAQRIESRLARLDSLSARDAAGAVAPAGRSR